MMDPNDEKRVILDLLRECGKAKRLVSIKSVECDSHTYTLYRYKTARWTHFYEKPCLAYARGTIVIDGEHLVLPFTKFFNANETPDTRVERLPEPLAAFEKLDGVLTVAWRDPVTGEARITTRGMLWNMAPGGRRAACSETINPYAIALSRYAREESLLGRLESLLDRYGILLFELYNPRVPASRLHPEDAAGKTVEMLADARPYLLAVRDADTLSLQPPPEGEWPLTPKRLPTDARELAMITVDYEGEGAVAWYGEPIYSGPLRMLDPLVKFKSKTYLLRVTGLQSKRSLIAYAIRGGIDDLRGVVSREELEVLEEVVALYERLRGVIWSLREDNVGPGELGVRGWLREAILDPDQLLPLLLRYGPRTPEKMRGFLEKSIARLEKRLARR